MMSPTFSRGARYACALTALFTVLLWCSSPAFAGTDNSNSFENKPLHLTSSGTSQVSSGSFSGTLTRTIIGLLVVIAVIYGLHWFLKQTRGSKNPAIGEGLVQVAQLPLGPNRSVALVRVGAELHLLGVAEHGITGIRVFSEEEAYELGLPFDPDEFDMSDGAGGLPPVQRMVDSLRRFTVR